MENIDKINDLHLLMVKLGWNEWDSDIWSKGENNEIKLPFYQAVTLELRDLLKMKRTFFECPDCGYKVQPQEFLESYDERLKEID